MDEGNLFWFFAFFFLFTAINLACGLCISYLDCKPLGHQSLFDCVLRDHFRIGKTYGAGYTLMIFCQNLAHFHFVFKNYVILIGWLLVSF